MKSNPRLALTILSVLSLIVLPGCLSVGGRAQVVPRAASDCSTLIPDNWRQDVPSAELPDTDQIGDWIKFGDAQTGQLDKANDRTRSSISIVEKCEKRDAEAQASLKKKPFWRFW